MLLSRSRTAFAVLPLSPGAGAAAPVPADRAKILRDAFMAAHRDPAYLEDARKAGLDVSPASGEEVARIVAETSYGERRRLELAMALAQKPKVLLLDEPLAGLSQGERQTLRELLAKIPRDVTIVMIEHDMDTALGFAEQITLLHYGEVIVEGTRAEVARSR